MPRVAHRHCTTCESRVDIRRCSPIHARTCTPGTECDSMSDVHHMIPSGIPPLDARLGGAIPGRIHMLSGGPGTGKTTAGPQFLRHGLQLGETVAMLTSDRLADLGSHATHLGM